MSFPPVKEQIDLIRRGASEIIPEEDLIKRSWNTPLRKTSL